MAVILGTLGLMDGFLYGLKSALKSGQGDVSLKSRDGFFTLDKTLSEELEILGISPEKTSALIQTEGFLIYQEASRGVIIRGISLDSFSHITGLNFPKLFKESKEGDIPGIVIGQQLAKDFGLSTGDLISLTFPQGDRDLRGMPVIRPMRILGTVKHNIYEQDQRYVYLDLIDLQQILNVGDRINILTFNIINQENWSAHSVEYAREVEHLFERARQRLNWSFVVRPFWHDFSTLIEAVEVQKGMITLILQTIVLISVFNVVALIIYFSEKKARDIFLFQALGMPRRRLSLSWMFFAFLVWLAAALCSLIFVWLFSVGVTYLGSHYLPGDVYYLENISLRITPFSYALILCLTLFWILLVAWFSLFRKRHHSLLSGLREEFS